MLIQKKTLSAVLMYNVERKEILNIQQYNCMLVHTRIECHCQHKKREHGHYKLLLMVKYCDVLNTGSFVGSVLTPAIYM